MSSNNDGVSLWQDKAECNGANPEIFSPDKKASDTTYKSFCSNCPVKAECLEYALIYGMFGIWGDTTDKERSKRISKSRLALLRDDYEESGLYNPNLKVA
jgi:WhiB family redox-sensing transcriptional regulator